MIALFIFDVICVNWTEDNDFKCDSFGEIIMCSQIHQPVCANNLVTYNNLCELANENCKYGNVLYLGFIISRQIS